MIFRVGIGILLPHPINDSIRAIEVDIADKTGGLLGLTQPPNITVKRPFELPDKDALDEFMNHLNELSSLPIDTVSYGKVASFPSGVVYLPVSHNQSLHALHKKLLEYCAQFHVEPDRFEGDNVIFHTTVAMGLTDAQTSQALAMIDEDAFAGQPFTPQHLGVFMWLPQSESWAVIKTLTVNVGS